MTKALFKKLNSIEGTMLFCTGCILANQGSLFLGLFTIFLGISTIWDIEGDIKRYKEEGYNITD